MWGVSDPAEQPRGRGCVARAGSLTPHFCSDSSAGALTGRHKTPPDHDERGSDKMMLSNGLRAKGRPRADRLCSPFSGEASRRSGANRAST
jgi:hypothetical protein